MSTREKLLEKTADLLERLAEKCGGPGGKPGPCPEGGSPRPLSGAGRAPSSLRPPRNVGSGFPGTRLGGPSPHQDKIEAEYKQEKEAAKAAFPKGAKEVHGRGHNFLDWVSTKSNGAKVIAATAKKLKAVGYQEKEGKPGTLVHPKGHVFTSQTDGPDEMVSNTVHSMQLHFKYPSG